MKRVITHYRVPSHSYKGQTRGKPSTAVLELYKRGVGFQDGDIPAARGGRTFYDIFDGHILIATGCAHCSYSDNFEYRKGRLIAEGRAKKHLESRISVEDSLALGLNLVNYLSKGAK